MTPSPYRSLPREERAQGPAELFYEPCTTSHFAQGTRTFFGCLVLGAIGGFVLHQALTGFGVGVAVGALGSVLRRRSGDAAGVLFRVDDSGLTIARGARGRPVITCAPLEDVLEVKLETTVISRGPRNVVLMPGFDVDQPTGGGSVDESRIAFLFRGRTEPLFVTTDRVTNIEATEWLARIRRFLREYGWMPLEERDARTEENEPPTELLSVGQDAACYTLRADIRRFELVLEATAPDGKSRCVFGAEELPLFTKLLLEGSGDRRRYEVLGHREKLLALLREQFVDPYGVATMTELRQFLDEHDLPCHFSTSQ